MKTKLTLAIVLIFAITFASCKQSVTPDPAPVTLSSITADYSSTNLIFPDTTLHTLKEDLTVTAHYSDGTSKKLVTEEYDLVGPLAAGSCTITVKYQSKETTFTVAVNTAHTHNWGNWEQIKAPTCMAVGEKQRQCTADPPHPETDDGDPIDTVNGHNWGTVTGTTPATCMSTGEGTRTCAINTAHIDAQAVVPINSSAHDYQWVMTTPASESENGVETLTCQHNNAHTNGTRPLYATGTNGLAFELIDNGTAYRVRKGTITGGAVAIPAYYNGLPVTEIGSSSDASPGSAFYGAGLTTVHIPATVTSIGAYAFDENRNLASVTFAGGSQLTTIHRNAFARAGLNTVMNVPIPATVTSIGIYAFQSSGITNVTLPAGVTVINDNMFNGCSKLTSVVVQGSVTTIGGNAFYNSALTTITFTDISQLQSIGNSAFVLCLSLTTNCDFVKDSQLQSIDYQAFGRCTIPSITIPASVTTVGNYAFNEWTDSQIIKVDGHADQASADTAWNARWRANCNAIIDYRG
jgi:hypothetical protein